MTLSNELSIYDTGKRFIREFRKNGTEVQKDYKFCVTMPDKQNEKHCFLQLAWLFANIAVQEIGGTRLTVLIAVL